MKPWLQALMVAAVFAAFIYEMFWGNEVEGLSDDY